MTHTDATARTDAEFQAMVDRVDAAPWAEESCVERVALALWRSDTQDEFPDADLERLWPKVVSHFPSDAATYRRNALAALDAQIVDHTYRPDRQGQWVTGRCDLCGEPKVAHLDPAVEHIAAHVKKTWS